MATFIKSFTFDNDIQSWVFTGTGGTGNSGYSSTGGNTGGCLWATNTNSSASRTINWTLNTTWESLGIPTGSTVTAVVASLDQRTTLANINSMPPTVGSFTIKDSGGTIQGTLYTGQSNIQITDTGWVARSTSSTPSTSAVTIPVSLQPSNSTLNLVFAGLVGMTNTTGTNAIGVDNLTLTITYTPPSATTIGPNVGTICVHDPDIWVAANLIDSALALNSTYTKLGVVFAVRKTGTITKLGFRISNFTTGALCRVGLYNVGSNGLPTSVPYGGSSYGTFTPAANSTFYEVTLGTPATVTSSSDAMAAIVIEYDSTAGNFNLSGLAGGTSGSYGYQVGLPYAARYSTSWTKAAQYMPIAASVGYSDGTYPRCGLLPISVISVPTSFASNSTYNEYALQFTPNFPCRVAGIWTNAKQVTGAIGQIGLYVGTTLLTNLSVSNLASYSMFQEFYFPTPQVLTSGSTYYAAIKATNTSTLSIHSYSTFSAAAVEALGFPSGWNACQATRNGSTWTSNTGSIPAIGLIIDQLNSGISSGSSGISRSTIVNKI